VDRGERLAREKEVIGFFISGHPLERYREEVALFGTRTTATLGCGASTRSPPSWWSPPSKRQISKKTGAEYARLTLEDFQAPRSAVFPEAWSKLSGVIAPDSVVLLTGGYSPRDRGEDRAPFIVEGAQPLNGLRQGGAVGVALTWSAGGGPDQETTRAATPCAPPIPVRHRCRRVERRQRTQARLRSRRLRVELEEELLQGSGMSWDRSVSVW